ncbi:MAG: signal recognition particle protein [Victivallales bacterium]|nr:signal recognition particle protein [Victivallales bacterium]MCF7889300.1 signal recognition particle protein [Victivallales bacterium]
MFDSLSNKLQDTFKKLKGQAYLTENNISEAMREIRLALLDADVSYPLAKEFVDSVKKDALGQEVLRSVTPGQQVIKIVNDKLVELMGTTSEELDLSKKPSTIMLIGLHGNGKTTFAGKLAAKLKKQGKKVLLVAADIYRPAAVNQLESLGKQIGVPVYSEKFQPRVDLLAKSAKEKAKQENFDAVILDTAGRHQVDTEMVQELVLISQMVLPAETLLVADSALGQEAVSVADSFHKALSLTGVILTKLDGDARGGAALSIRKTTNCPIKMVSVGEKIDDIENFHPDRIASRILGMGDVVSLVEQASEQIEAEEAEKLEKRLKSNQFDFNDFLSQMNQMKKMGGLSKIMKMLPGGKELSKFNIDDKQFSQMEAVICSMNKKERANPAIIDFSRRKRIAAGAGVNIQQVNSLLKRFFTMKKMMKKTSMMNDMMSEMGMPSMPGSMGGAAGGLTRGPKNMKKKQRRKKPKAHGKNKKKKKN